LMNVAPKRNLILVRLTGGPLASTGVLAGVSGSPVYLKDRLAGAVGFTWGLSEEAGAGVTPPQAMLSIEDQESPSPSARARRPAPPGSGAAGLGFVRDPGRLPAYFASYFDQALSVGTAASPMNPIATPLLFSGIERRVLDDLAPGLLRAGLVPIQGGSSG